MKTPPEPRRRKPKDEDWLKYLKSRVEMRTSSYFEPNDFQIVTIARGDLRRLIREYENS